MKKSSLTAAVIGVTMVTALATPAVAAAIPPSGTAAEVVQALQDQGYTVQFNGPVNGPLARCGVNGVHGLIVMAMPDGSLMMKMDPTNPGVAYVDVSCPTSND